MKNLNCKGILSKFCIRLAMVIAQSISHTMITKTKYSHAEDPSSLYAK